MLSRINRLKKEKDFKRVYRYGKFTRGNFFDIYFLSDSLVARFGIVATTKTIKKAAKRNKAKRIVRGFLQKSKDFWPKGLLIVKIKREIGISEKIKAASELESILKRL